MTFPAGLLPPEAKPSDQSWQEYENPQVSRVGIDVFRVSGRESSTNSFSRGYQSYNALQLTYIHNSGSELIAEGAGSRWGSRYYFHNMTFEFQGGQRGIYIRFDMKPPEGFVPPPEILPAARLDKIKKQIAKLYHGGRRRRGAADRGGGRLVADRPRRVQHRRLRLLRPERLARADDEELRVRHRQSARAAAACASCSRRRATIANKDGDMTTMFGNTASDKITFGCVQVNPRLRAAWRADLSRRLAGGARAANARIKLRQRSDRPQHRELRAHRRYVGGGGRHARAARHPRLQQLVRRGDAGGGAHRRRRRLQGPRLHVLLAERQQIAALPAGRR